MKTRQDMRTGLRTLLRSASNSTLLSDTVLNTELENAHQWATAFFPFPQLTKAKQTTTDGMDYVDYPQEMRIGSIHDTIYINDEPYVKTFFNDFYKFRIEHQGETDTRLFSEMGDFIFFFPTPAIGLNCIVFGQVTDTAFSSDSSTSIFSKSNEQGNEAIVKKAYSVLIKPQDGNKAISEEKDAIGILTILYNSFVNAYPLNQHINKPQFNVPDFIGNRVNTTPGTFHF